MRSFPCALANALRLHVALRMASERRSPSSNTAGALSTSFLAIQRHQFGDEGYDIR